MFNNEVTTYDVTGFPETYKTKITPTIGLDYTLLITLVLLMYQRDPDANFEYYHYTTTHNIDINTDKKFYSFYFFEEKDPSEIESRTKGIEKLPAIESFLNEKLQKEIEIRIIPEANTVCFFGYSLSFQVFHAVQFFIPKYFKIFKEKPLTQDEKKFLETLTYRTKTQYVEKVNELLNSESFRKHILGEMLCSFEKRLFSKKVEAARKSLDGILKQMEDYLQEYKKACESKLQAEVILRGLESMEAEKADHTELESYLMNNNRLCNVQVEGSCISFIVKTFLAPHHIDEWNVIAKDSWFKLYVNGTYDLEAVKLILNSIFSEKRCMRLKMCAYFKMNYFGSEVASSKNYPYKEKNKELVNYVPNPHLYHHNCFGQNAKAILDQLAAGDMIGAIECATACAQRVNIHESYSFNPFVRDLFACKGKCLVGEDGTEYTIDEALDYLRSNK